MTPVKQTKAASELGLSDDDLDNIDAALEAGKVGKSEKVRKKNKKKVTPKKKTQKVSQKEKKAGKKTGNGKNKADMHLQAQEDSCGIPQREGQVQEAWVQPYNLQEDGKGGLVESGPRD